MERSMVTPHDQSGIISASLQRRWMKSAVLFFFIAAVFGTSMRYFFVKEIPFLDYKHLLHAHSHVALLGWGFMLISGGLIFLLLKSAKKRAVYKYLYLVNVVAVFGMAIFFTYQGYGTYSIFFSTIHLLAVYFFSYHFLGDLKLHAQTTNPFIRWSIFWLLISTIGLWAIAPISIWLGKLHPLYYMSIQFFLHFQFNGWFTYAILGLLLHHLLKNGYEIKIPATGFWMLQISLLLTYALSITWSTPLSVIFYLNSIGVIIQVIAFAVILQPVVKTIKDSFTVSDWTDWLLVMGILSLMIKILVQVAVAMPSVASISYTIRNYVIGFIHLIMLGSVTLTGVAILLKNKLLPTNQVAKFGWIFLTLAFLIMEIILFGQGTLLWMEKGFIDHYYELLLYITLLLPISLIFILLSFAKPLNTEELS